MARNFCHDDRREMHLDRLAVFGVSQVDHGAVKIEITQRGVQCLTDAASGVEKHVAEQAELAVDVFGCFEECERLIRFELGDRAGAAPALRALELALVAGAMKHRSDRRVHLPVSGRCRCVRIQLAGEIIDVGSE